jgi:regulator of protease activity HflC (stomatin/prohibitin superfamily)
MERIVKTLLVTGLGILGIICLVAPLVLDTSKQSRKPAAVLGVIFLLLCFLGNGFEMVPAGYRGVLLRFGAVQGVLGEGLHFVTPFASKVSLMEVRTMKADAKASSSSSDLQVVTAEVAVNYHVSPDKVGELYKTVGLSYEDRVVNPAVQETLKSITAKFTAAGLVTERAAVKAMLDDQVSKRLARYDLIVEPSGVSLVNLEFSAEFNKSIEEKQVAQQNSQKALYLLNQAKTEASTAIAKAKGEAESNRLKAIALNVKGGQQVLAREWIDKWDGKLPTVSGGTSSNLIDIKSLMETAPVPAK